MELLELVSDGRTRTVAMTGARITIGRGMQNDVALPEDVGVSREHAVLSHQQGAWLITDSDSTNGTFVNGVRVKAPTAVRPGDRITVGASELKVTTDSSTTALHRFRDLDAAINAGDMRVSVADRRLLELLSKGATDEEISAALRITPAKAEAAVIDLEARMGATNRVDLARLAVRLGVN
ncbi:MAG: FHA domain-containing protein [Candidatus Nanopelagicales bacterium]